MNATGLITDSLKDLGVVAAGETPTPEDLADGLTALQRLCDALGAERLSMAQNNRSVVSLVNGTQSYTIGTGGAFNIPRPLWIDGCGCLTTASGVVNETPVTILTEKQYAAIGIKALSNALVEAIYYDYAWTAGLGNIIVWPYPNVSGLQLALYVPQPVSTFADLTTSYTFPPAVGEMLEYNLARRLMVKYPRAQAIPQLLELAAESWTRVQDANIHPELLSVDLGLAGQGRYRILSDSVR